MKKSSRIEYYDLREEALAGNLPVLVGRRDVLNRFDRVIRRGVSNNIMLVGQSGCGKTALVHGWINKLAHNPLHADTLLLQLDAAHIPELDDPAAEERFAEATIRMPKSIVCVDSFGKDVLRNAVLMQCIERLYAPLLKRSDVHMFLTLENQEFAWLEKEFPAFVRLFETIHLKEQRAHEHRMILEQSLPRLNAMHRILVPDAALREIVEQAERYKTLGALPRSAIRLLDESLALCALKGEPMLRSDDIAEVIETKIGIPKHRFAGSGLQRVGNLETDLNAKIIGQKEAIAHISSTLLRAKLGLRNAERPLGSFLMLGPSGVGKTETAKTVAEMIFGKSESFLRFDMSEFQQDHTVQRLLGSPAGYVGHEEGGALTNALKRDPYSLILLDEIEKAHPKVFDIFLQVLDDGRLTSGQNETVDARNTVIMATSNAAVSEILAAKEAGIDTQNETFIKDTIVPILSRTFRLEFINRFDKIVVFDPLTVENLVHIAELEIRKLETRLSKYRIQFDIDADTIAKHVRHIADPRFGARPIKRFVEETCESLVVESLVPLRT